MRMEKDIKMVEGNFQRPTFLIAIPTLGTVPIEFMLAFSRLAMPMNCTSSTMVVTKTEIGVARNAVAEAALNMKPRPKYILFIGDDMLPPWDGVIKIWKTMEEDSTWDVLSGLYYIKQDTPIPIIWKKEVDGWLEPFKHYSPGEVVQCDIIGMDFTMIRTEVFVKMNSPWFLTGPMSDTEYKKVFCPINLQEYYTFTEDVWFCHKAKQFGLKIGVHTGVRVGHLYIKTGEVY